jgi:hypothetical protein
MKLLTARQYLDVQQYWLWQGRNENLTKAVNLKDVTSAKFVVQHVCELDEEELKRWLRDNRTSFIGNYSFQYESNIVVFEYYEDALLLCMSK